MEGEKGPYQPLRTSDNEPEHELDENVNLKGQHPARRTKYVLLVVIGILTISNGLLLLQARHCKPRQPSKTYWNSDKILLKPFHWITDYSSENKTDTSPLWSSIFPVGDGLVALKDDWASSQRLPSSIKRFHDSDESIYFVAAYHELHCLAIIRSVIYHLKEGVKLGVPFIHATHCLDSLRQSVMCHADDTLLYTEDTHSYGDGQPRVCKDWDALVKWTEEHRIWIEEVDGPREKSIV